MDLGAGERRRYATSPRCEPPDDMDDDLLFDMDYDIESDRRRRSASADSFRSCHNRSGVGLSVERFYDGEEAQLDEAEEAGPDMGVARVRSFKLRQEEWYGSLPGHHNSRHRYTDNLRRQEVKVCDSQFRCQLLFLASSRVSFLVN